MARSKNATALFEVIHTSKKPPKASPSGGIPAPKWWSKGGKGADRPAEPTSEAEDQAAPQPEPSGGTRRSWLAAARRPAEPAAVEGPADEPDAPDEASKVVITRIYPPNAPDRRGGEPLGQSSPPFDDEEGPVFATPPVDEATEEPAELPPVQRPMAVRRPRAERPSDPTFDPTANRVPDDLRAPRSSRRFDEEPPPTARPQRQRQSAGPRPSALKAAVEPALFLDRSAGEVRVRLSYGGAIAGAVILLVVLLIAFLLGQSVGQHGGAEAADLTAANSRSAPADGVTASGPASSTGMMAAASTTTTATTPAPDHPPAQPTPAITAPTPGPLAADAGPAEPVTRQVGQMYVVIQNYPDRETADRASEFLSRSGVPNSVVPGLSGFALRDWFSVVGLQPFARGDHRPAVQTYLQQLTDLGFRFSPTKAYDRFQPQLYTWRADSDTPRP